MEHTQEVALRLTQEELLLTHSALCDYRARLGNLMVRWLAWAFPPRKHRRFQIDSGPSQPGCAT